MNKEQQQADTEMLPSLAHHACSRGEREHFMALLWRMDHNPRVVLDPEDIPLLRRILEPLVRA